jgi:hypothetical protein
MRRGIFTHVALRQQAACGRVLHSELLGSCSPASSFNGHRRKRWSGQGVARKRHSDWTATFGVLLRGVLAAPRALRRKDCRGSWFSCSFFERGGSTCSQRHDESENMFEVTA